MSVSETWSWEDAFPQVFQPSTLDLADHPGRALKRLHSSGLHTFYLQILEENAHEKMLCVCRFPRISGSEYAEEPTHVRPSEILTMIRERYKTPVVVYVHGNAESVHTSFAACDFVVNQIDAIYVSFEWRGYGMEGSKRPRFKAQSDRCGYLVRFVLSDRLQSAHRNPVYLLGYSLGCAVLLDAVERIRSESRNSCDQDLACRLVITILLAPFLSAAALVISPAFLTDVVTHIFRPMNNARAIRSLRSDVLVVHGMNDDVIPSNHSPKLLEIFKSSVMNLPHRSKLVLLKDATHNTLLTRSNGSRVANSLREFMAGR
eukprot:gene277-525_t